MTLKTAESTLGCVWGISAAVLLTRNFMDGAVPFGGWYAGLAVTQAFVMNAVWRAR